MQRIFVKVEVNILHEGGLEEKVTFAVWYRIRCPIYCDHVCSSVFTHLISNHS